MATGRSQTFLLWQPSCLPPVPSIGWAWRMSKEKCEKQNRLKQDGFEAEIWNWAWTQNSREQVRTLVSWYCYVFIFAFKNILGSRHLAWRVSYTLGHSSPSVKWSHMRCLGLRPSSAPPCSFLLMCTFRSSTWWPKWFYPCCILGKQRWSSLPFGLTESWWGASEEWTSK